MTLAHAACVVNLSSWFATPWPVISAVVATIGVAMSLYEFFQKRRAAKRSTAPYKARWQAELTKARAQNPNLVLMKPAVKKGDDPEIFDLAWAEFDQEQISIFAGNPRWNR